MAGLFDDIPLISGGSDGGGTAPAITINPATGLPRITIYPPKPDTQGSGGGQPLNLAPTGAGSGSSTLSPRARDLAIRTIYGEAEAEPDIGKAGVAAVIRNRAESGQFGKSVPEVVLRKYQFEPWQDPTRRKAMLSLSPDSPAYQNIGKIVDGVFSGAIEDPTGGATHFYSPTAQAALGRQAPSWARGEGVPIGRHTFYAPDGSVRSAAAPAGNQPVQTATGPAPEQPPLNLAQVAQQPAQIFTAQGPQQDQQAVPDNTALAYAPDQQQPDAVLPPQATPAQFQAAAQPPVQPQQPQPTAGAPQAQPSAPQAGLFDDVPMQRAPTLNDRFAPAADVTPSTGAPELKAGLENAAQALTRPPVSAQQSPVQKLAIEAANVGPAASQGTNPNIDRYKGQLISSDVFESDSGEILYRDPQSGQVVPTDQNKQVVLRDPADNTLKVFSRSDATDENKAVSLARVLAPGLVSGAPTARAGIAAIPAVKPGQEVAAAAQRLGVDVPRAITTDSTAAQRMGAAVKNIPIAGDPLVNASKATVEQMGGKAAEISRGLGSGDAATAGDTAKTAINRYITGTTKAKATELYDKVDNLVDNSITVPLENTRGVAAEIIARRANAALGEDSKAVSTIFEAITRKEGLNYQGVKDLRTAIGEMLDRGILPEGMSQGELKRIYSALSDDLRTTISVAGGPKAMAAFDRANRYYKLVSERREALAKIIGVKGDVPAEKVFDRLLGMASSSSRADVSKLMQARRAIGADDWNEFASGVVSRLGRDPAFAGPEKLAADNFSPQRFSTAYGKLSDAGRTLLFNASGNPAHAQQLKDLATISQRWKELQQFGNPSGTGQTIFGGGILTGAFFEPTTIIGTVIGGRALSMLLARPATAASAVRWARSYEQLVKTPSTPRLAALELASKNLVTNLKDIGVNVSPTDFLRAIQGSVKSSADEDQSN